VNQFLFPTDVLPQLSKKIYCFRMSVCDGNSESFLSEHKISFDTFTVKINLTESKLCKTIASGGLRFEKF
jgi:hypothetical protein